jgi:hypothetical protein
MDVPVGAQVYCGNELCGRSTHVILDLMTNKVTHIVVEQEGSLPARRMVPIEWLDASTSYQLVLHCSHDELAKSKHLQAESISSDLAETKLGHGRVSPFQLAVGQGAWVEAWDGYAGLVDEFLIDPRTRCVTHVVLREVHLWGDKGIAVPVSAISCMEENRVRVRLNIDSVRGLPSVPTQQSSAADHGS